MDDTVWKLSNTYHITCRFVCYVMYRWICALHSYRIYLLYTTSGWNWCRERVIATTFSICVHVLVIVIVFVIINRVRFLMKYTHVSCFVVVCYPLILATSFRVASLTLGQSCNCHNCQWSSLKLYGQIPDIYYFELITITNQSSRAPPWAYFKRYIVCKNSHH